MRGTKHAIADEPMQALPIGHSPAYMAATTIANGHIPAFALPASDGASIPYIVPASYSLVRPSCF